MKNVLLFLFLSVTSYCLAQSNGAVPNVISPPTNVNTGLITSNNRFSSKYGGGLISYEKALLEYDNISGSPFLHDGEITVDFIFYNDSIIKDVNIKYDLYGKEVIINKNDDEVIILDQMYYKGFTYVDETGQEELYLRMTLDDRNFYHILFMEEDFIFCKMMNLRVDKVTRHVPGIDILPARFSRKAEYFIMDNDNPLTKVSLKHEELISHLPEDYKEQVSSLKSQLEIKRLRKEEDYIRLMNAFDTTAVQTTQP